VERAKPKWLELRITAAEALSAAIPCGGEISTSPLPSVRMIRQPPAYVPRPIASAPVTLTHNGIEAVSVHSPAARRARVMTFIVFWASFVPWASETSDALPIWPRRKPWSVKRVATPATAL
jgi:hypothetical protein